MWMENFNRVRRIALIIGDSGGASEHLPGVELDVKSYKNFLMSSFGGNWRKNEIIILLNKSIYFIKNLISSVKGKKYDFAFVVFTGHGYYSQYAEQRMLIVRKYGLYKKYEKYELYEEELMNLAPKEILIIDSCAGMQEEIFPPPIAPIAEGIEGAVVGIDRFRQIYDNAIKDSHPQQIVLYASSPGEKAIDTPKGGLFSKALLEIAYSYSSNKSILNAITVGKLARKKVKYISKGKQNPQIKVYIPPYIFNQYIFNDSFKIKPLPFSISP